MVTTEAQRQDIIINNPNKARVERAQLKNKELRRHKYGEGLKEHFTQVAGLEPGFVKSIRSTYSISNRDLFARLGKNIDKVFSARGGSIYYNLTDNLNKMAMQLSFNVRNGYSATKWIENFWTPHFEDDPDGMLFMEISEGKAYPTYKSSQSYYDYEPVGNSVEYVCFKVAKRDKIAAGYKEEDQIFRLVDDAYDYWLKRDGDKVATLIDHTYPNYYGYVPCILNSDIVDPENEGHMLSIFSDIIERAEYYLTTGSIKIANEIRHGFPKYWEYAGSCTKCKGTTVFNCETCVECNGSGKSMMIRFDTAKALPMPDKDDVVIAPNVAGFVEYPRDYHEIATQMLAMFEDLMNYTIWGYVARQQTTGLNQDNEGVKTATQIVGEMQTTIDKLYGVSESAEKRIKFIIDHKVKLELRSDYSGASVSLGRRYMIETADELWDRYTKARKDGADDSLLDELLVDFYETKYGTDPVGMGIMLKLMYVVPFFHKTIEQVQSLGVPEEDYKAKLYAGEWQKQLQDIDLMKKTAPELREMLMQYAKTKVMPEKEPVPPATFSKN